MMPNSNYFRVMRNLLLTLLLALSAHLPTYAQEELEFALRAEQSFFGNRIQQLYGLDVYVPLGERFTVDWQVGIGPQQKGGYHAHAPIGLVSGAWLLGNLGGGDRTIINVVGVLLLVLPEGMGVYLNTEGRFRNHISLHPLGFEYWYRRQPYDELGKIAGTIQYRLKAIPKEDWPIYIAPTFAATMIYKPENRIEQWGFRIGLTIGYVNY
jgi:hypothetical protein